MPLPHHSTGSKNLHLFVPQLSCSTCYDIPKQDCHCLIYYRNENLNLLVPELKCSTFHKMPKLDQYHHCLTILLKEMICICAPIRHKIPKLSSHCTSITHSTEGKNQSFCKSTKTRRSDIIMRRLKEWINYIFRCVQTSLLEGKSVCQYVCYPFLDVAIASR